MTPRIGIALVVGTLALGVLPIPPQQPMASAVPRVSVLETFDDRGLEQRYLNRVIELLDAAVANRVKLDRALRMRRSPAEYRWLLDEFRERQLGLLLHLHELQAPPRMFVFQEGIRAAVIAQTAFYTAFVAEKIRDPKTNLDDMIGHPALRASNAALRAAFDQIRRLHPAIDQRTESTIESQISWLEEL